MYGPVASSRDRIRLGLLGLWAAFGLGGLEARAERFFATQVLSIEPGWPQNPRFAVPDYALDGPRGTGVIDGSYDVYNLGVGGSITLGLDEPNRPRAIADLPGPDFIIFENAIHEGGPTHTFAELMFVEVSSNGIDFARFPVVSNTPEPIRWGGTIDAAQVSGFAGVNPVLANIDENDIDPFDPAAAGGDAFDLADLADHPLVRSGTVDLKGIRAIRLIDVKGDGSQLDSNGRPIFDPLGPGNEGADLDAIAVLHSAAPGLANRWKGAGDNYHLPDNWLTGQTPDGPDAVARFLSDPGAPSLVNLAAPVTLGQIEFDREQAYTLVGPGPLTLQASGAALIRLAHGNHIIAAPLHLQSSTVIEAQGNTLTLKGQQHWADEVSLTVQSGRLIFNTGADAGRVGENALLRISPGATVEAGGSGDPFFDGTRWVSVANEATFLVTAGHKHLAAVYGSGDTVVSGPGTVLVVGGMRQNTLVIGPGAKVVLGLDEMGGQFPQELGGLSTSWVWQAPRAEEGQASTGVVPEPQGLAAVLSLMGAMLRRRRPRGGGTRPAPARCRHRAGFSLVELLVVIGIIALLLGILLPALSAARQSSRRTACASNLRQLAMAAQMYAQENQGFWPPAHLAFLTKNLHRWHGTRAKRSEPFDFAGSPLRNFLQVAAVKRCPSFEPQAASGAQAFEAACGGYGYNAAYLGSGVGQPSSKNAPMGYKEWEARIVNVPAKQGMIHDLARKIAFADTAMAVAGGTLIEYSFAEPPLTEYGPTSPSIHFRHAAQANIAWADGHVTAERFEWTYPTNTYGVSNAPALLGFFGPRDNRLFQRD